MKTPNKKIVICAGIIIFLALPFRWWYNHNSIICVAGFPGEIIAECFPGMDCKYHYYHYPYSKDIMYYGCIKYNKITGKMDLSKIRFDKYMADMINTKTGYNVALWHKNKRISLREWRKIYSKFNYMSFPSADYMLSNIKMDIFSNDGLFDYPRKIEDAQLLDCIHSLYRYSYIRGLTNYINELKNRRRCSKLLKRHTN